MALQTNYTTMSNIELAESYIVVTNLQINKVMNDATSYNPNTDSDEVTVKHYRVTYSADVWKDAASRDGGSTRVDVIGEVPGDMSFSTVDINDVTAQCYAHISDFLQISHLQQVTTVKNV